MKKIKVLAAPSKVCLVIIIGLFFKNVINAQDSFEKLSYEDFHVFEAEAFENNNQKWLQKLTRKHINKAKLEKDNIELARAFYYLAISEKGVKGASYADSIIIVTQESKHSNFPTLGYIIKGRLLYNSGNFQNALKQYLKAYDFALQKNNLLHQQEISLAIAAVKNVNGQHSAAAQLYKRSLDQLTQKNNYEYLHYDDYLVLLFNLSLTHIRLHQLDSAKFFSDKGIILTRFSEDSEGYRDFVLVDAQINYMNKDFLRARDSLIKYLEGLEGTDLAYKYYYLGKVHYELDDEEWAIKSFQKVDSILEVTQDPFNEIRDVYQSLVLFASKRNNKKEQLKYLDKLIFYDSILNAKQGGVLDRGDLGFEVPFLKHQKDMVEKQLYQKGAALNGIGVLLGLAILVGAYFYRKARLMKRNIRILLDTPTSFSNTDVLTHPLNVPEEIRENVLQKLKEFEDSEDYLVKDLDMGILAQQFNTNTTYLSTVVNHYKGMNFPTYLKDLKISMAIRHLSEEPELLKYNYQGLAEKFGFKTGESFSKAFYSKTGVYPSKFLAELKLRKMNRHL